MRVYQGDSTTPGDPRPHTFVETRENAFLEVELPYMETLSEGDKNRARAFVRKIRAEEKRTNSFHMHVAYRYFATIHPVPNLRLVGEF